MPKKQTKRTKKQPTTMFTLKEAHVYIDSLPNADNSKVIWKSALTTLVHYNEALDIAPNTTLTKAELYEQYQDLNILPLIQDSGKIIDIVDDQIVSSRDGRPIQLETKKSYYAAIIRLTQRGSPCQVPKETRDIYNDKLKDIGKLSNDTRNLNEPKRANLLYPDFKWLDAVNEYNQYIAEKPFTNTPKGRKELRIACAVGLYILQRPRRVQDYSTLQWFSKKPSESQMKDRNILYMDDGKMYMSIDRFKTRWRVAGGATSKTEVLPRFEKEVNSRLASLFKDYINKAAVRDMSKLTSTERRGGVNYYVFFKDDEEAHDDNSFSKVLTGYFKAIFKKPKLTVNTFRHMFNTHISENIQQYTDKQLQEIAVDVGDTPKNLPTNLRYRIAEQANRGMEKSQIDEQIQDNDYARNLMRAAAEEEGSVGNVAEDDADEEVSPTQPVTRSVGNVTDNDVKRAQMELINLQIAYFKAKLQKINAT